MESTISPPCYICGYRTTIAENGEYFRCTHCGTVRTIYKYNAKIYGEGYANNYLRYAETDVNTPLNLSRMGLISRWLKEGNRILDIGCCVGSFIQFAEKYYRCVGFEPNREAGCIARRKCKSQIVYGIEKIFSEFECVTMFDVLEHLEDPLSILKLVKERFLVSGGILVVVTPNVEVIPAYSDGMVSWKHYKPKEHLFLYTPSGLETLFGEIGMEIIHWSREESDIRPGNPNGDILTCVAKKS